MSSSSASASTTCRCEPPLPCTSLACSAAALRHLSSHRLTAPAPVHRVSTGFDTTFPRRSALALEEWAHVLGAQVAPRRGTGSAATYSVRVPFARLCGTCLRTIRVSFVSWCCGLALGACTHRTVLADVFSCVMCSVRGLRAARSCIRNIYIEVSLNESETSGI